MAIAFRAETHDVSFSSGTLNMTEPTGTAQNDVLLYLTVAETGSVITQPSGWTTLYSGASITPDFDYVLAYVVRGASPPDLSWNITGNPYHEVFVLSFSGCNTSNPINTSAQTASDVGVNPDSPSATASVSSAMALAVGIGWAGAASGGWTPPANYTLVTYNPNGIDGAIASRLLAGAGAEDPAAFVNSGGSDDRWSATIILAPSATAPSVSTFAATSITPTTATGNGSVDSDGGSTITERGICWSTSPLPTTSDSKATSAGTTGPYTANMTGLSNNVTYHMRAYAINAAGTSYGPNITMISNGGPVSWIAQ